MNDKELWQIWPSHIHPSQWAVWMPPVATTYRRFYSESEALDYIRVAGGAPAYV